MALLKLIPDNTNLPFMRWRNVALALSLLLIAASLASGLAATAKIWPLAGAVMVAAAVSRSGAVAQAASANEALATSRFRISFKITLQRPQAPRVPGRGGGVHGWRDIPATIAWDRAHADLTGGTRHPRLRQ